MYNGNQIVSNYVNPRLTQGNQIATTKHTGGLLIDGLREFRRPEHFQLSAVLLVHLHRLAEAAGDRQSPVPNGTSGPTKTYIIGTSNVDGQSQMGNMSIN